MPSIWSISQATEFLSNVVPAPGQKDIHNTSDCDQLSVTARMSNNAVMDAPVTCCTCTGVVLYSREQQVEHYKSPHHHNNLLRKVHGQEPLSLESFQLTGKDGESSLSASDCEDSHSDTSSDGEEEEEEGEEENSHRPHRSPSPVSPSVGRKPRVFFLNNDTGQVVSVYRTLLLPTKAAAESAEALVAAVRSLPARLKWSFLMQSGGRFAGAVYHGERVVVHKTFHSYTVRAGQGGSQSTHENTGAAHRRTAGSSLRRYNEASHNQHVQEILEAWQDYLRDSDLIFVRVSRRNLATMFGCGSSGSKAQPSLLNSKDPRVRTVPFPTRKPTFAEIKRVHKLLSEIKIHGTVDEYLTELAAETARASQVEKVGSSDCRPHGCQPTTTNTTTNATSNSNRQRKDRARNSARSSAGDSSSSSSNSRCGSEEAPRQRRLPSVTEALESTEQQTLGGDADKTTSKKKKKQPKGNSAARDGGRILVEAIVKQTLDEQRVGSVASLLYTACKTGDLPRLEMLHSYCTSGQQSAHSPYMSDYGGSVRECVEQSGGQLAVLQLRLGSHNKTALHVATENNHKDVVRWLLESGECDPSIVDARGRAPYTHCSNKAMKLLYREYRAAHPHAWDYTKSLIPAPLSEEQEVVLTEEKKAQKVAKKARQKENRLKREELLKEQKERERYLNLSDREKRALAAERRFLASLPSTDNAALAAAVVQKPVFLRCFQCANDISGLVPFEYSDNKFCSTACVRLHRDNAKVVTRAAD